MLTTTLIVAAAIWLPLAVTAAITIGRSITIADREQRAHRAAAQQTRHLRPVA